MESIEKQLNSGIYLMRKEKDEPLYRIRKLHTTMLF